MIKRRLDGFTIVELLIVIVVIGILAAIVIVAFNGIQARAGNTKTVSAAGSWVKAFKMYYTEKGDVPPTTRACLGTGYPTGYAGSINGQCRINASDTEVTALNNDLKPYMNNNLPPPDMTAIGTSSDWFRGILFYTSAPDKMLAVTIRGISSASDCPQIAGTTFISAGSTSYDGGVPCRYRIEF